MNGETKALADRIEDKMETLFSEQKTIGEKVVACEGEIKAMPNAIALGVKTGVEEHVKRAHPSVNWVSGLIALSSLATLLTVLFLIFKG